MLLVETGPQNQNSVMRFDRSTITFALKVLSVWLLIDTLLMAVLMVPLSTDGAPPPIAEVLYPMIHYVVGFPLVYIDPAFPYFLQGGQLPIMLIPLMLLNYVLKVLPFIVARNFVGSSPKAQAA